jgi:large subunit ribosomal protein L14e
MTLFNVGRICMKIAGRDSGRKCVIVEVNDDHFVVVDGDVRRRKVNIKHLEPLAETVEIKDKASHDDVKKVFEKLELKVWDRKSKKPAERVKRLKKVKVKKPVKKGKDKKESPKVDAKPVESSSEKKKE